MGSDSWSPFWRQLPATITDLDLSGNSLSDHAVSALCGALRLSCPARLGLRGNRCKDIGRLCGLIAGGQLESLDLRENMLNDKSIDQLCEGLACRDSALRSLLLSRNVRLSSSGLRQLAELLPQSSLRELWLDKTGLCDAGVEAFAAALPQSMLSELRVHATRLSDAG